MLLVSPISHLWRPWNLCPLEHKVPIVLLCNMQPVWFYEIIRTSVDTVQYLRLHTLCGGALFPSSFEGSERSRPSHLSIYSLLLLLLLSFGRKKENHLLLFFKPNFEKGARSTTPLHHTRRAACHNLRKVPTIRLQNDPGYWINDGDDSSASNI